MKTHILFSTVASVCAILAMVSGCAVVSPAGSGLGGGGMSPVTQSSSTPSKPAVPTGAAVTEGSVPATGAAVDSSEDVWIAGDSSLAVSRDGGNSWLRLPLPNSEGVIAALVLPSEVIAVAGAGSNTLSVSTMVAGQTSWHTTSITVPPSGGDIGSAQVVQEAGAPVGILVTDQSSAQFSHGQWVRAVSGGASWQVGNAPAGGVVTTAGGSLWLVGGPLRSELYRSGDDGVSWQTVALPNAPSLTGLGPVFPDGTGVVMPAAIAASSDAATIHMLRGQPSDGAWQWTVGPTLPTSGSFGPGAVPTTSLADGTVWLLTTESIVRLALPSEQSQVVAPSGLPNGLESLDLHAVNSTSAWIDYLVSTCAQFKSDCTTSTGLLRTTDGGATWQPMRNPLSNN